MTFEDKRKMNYEKGRQELERRRKEIQDRLQKEKVNVSKSLQFGSLFLRRNVFVCEITGLFLSWLPHVDFLNW